MSKYAIFYTHKRQGLPNKFDSIDAAVHTFEAADDDEAIRLAPDEWRKCKFEFTKQVNQKFRGIGKLLDWQPS